MLCINSNSLDPYFNIAAEEYLLKFFTDNIFMLYRNEPSVIVGKHQNTLAELDMDFVESQGIKVVRRLSGGGAVYHDLGNLNFTFIKNGNDGQLADFRGYTRPIIDALAKFGLEAKFEGHNSLMVNGKKISGNAEHIYKKRVLHHGTLLFSSNLDNLSRVLYVDYDRFTDRAIKSVRAEVTNIAQHLSNDITIQEFSDFLMAQIMQTNKNSVPFVFSYVDKGIIKGLIENKYSTWSWNFGYSPSYKLTREVETQKYGIVIYTIRVEKGIVEEVEIKGDGLPEKHIEEIRKLLIGSLHSKQNFSRKMQSTFADKDLLRSIIESAF